MNNFLFRKINADHCQEIFILQRKYIQDFGNNIWETDELRSLIKNKKISGVVYIPKKKICGFCFFKRIDDFIEIYSLFVDPVHRNQGVAEKFIKNCVEFCEKNNLKKIILDVSEKNFKAIQFYRKHNFIFCGKRKNYYREEESFFDSYSMNLIL